MEQNLAKLLDQACQIAGSLFARGKTSGSSANMSFLHQDRIYITASGSCFGTLTPEDFAETDLIGRASDKKPSKELPLHLALYSRPGNSVQAVIHTHSFYSVLWSCIPHKGKEQDVMPSYTPYLDMKLGAVQLVPFASPGSEELFGIFRNHVTEANGYLLAHHGPVVGGKSLLEAFYALEELEESAKIAWELRNEPGIAILR